MPGLEATRFVKPSCGFTVSKMGDGGEFHPGSDHLVHAMEHQRPTQPAPLVIPMSPDRLEVTDFV